MSVMPLFKSNSWPLNKHWLKLRQQEMDADWDYVWSKMKAWPTTWQIDAADALYGQQLLEELKPFVINLIQTEQLARSTLRRHLDQLFLLGGEIVSQINTGTQDRKHPPARTLDKLISSEGGPLSRHIDNELHQRQFDATCKKLYKFRLSKNVGH
jgi:hypothetical protein